MKEINERKFLDGTKPYLLTNISNIKTTQFKKRDDNNFLKTFLKMLQKLTNSNIFLLYSLVFSSGLRNYGIAMCPCPQLRNIMFTL